MYVYVRFRCEILFIFVLFLTAVWHDRGDGLYGISVGNAGNAGVFMAGTGSFRVVRPRSILPEMVC